MNDDLSKTLSPEFLAFFHAEGDATLNHAVEMAIKMIEKYESVIPFAVVIKGDGERVVIAPDDRVTTDRQILADTVRSTLRDGFGKLEFRTVAFVRNVVVDGSERISAIQITIEQVFGKHVTCYLPYEIIDGKLSPKELYATAPVEKFIPDTLPQK